jgi:ATP-dependent helicase/nuclease subunit A
MNEEKKRRGIMTFSDVRRHTLRLLVEPDGSPSAIAKQYAAEFSDIYIDEYQDVDRVQDLIFRSIAKPNNRFMVGDIKQSIYSFRGAEPSLFAGYRSAFPSIDSEEARNSEAASIFMSENFRCDESIIDFTNLICSRIFSVCEKAIGYRPEDDLRFAKEPPTTEYRSPKVEVVVISPPPKDEETKEEDGVPEKKDLEALFIAKEIDRLIRTEKKADGTPILPGDIAVLYRSRSMGAHLTHALNAMGILTSESDGERYFESPDVLMVLCLLNTVDNPPVR